MEQDSSGTAVVIFWIILRDPSQRTRREVLGGWDYALVQYRIVDKQVDWTVNKILEVSRNGSYKVTGLLGDEYYEFHFLLFTNSGEFGLPVDVGKSKFFFIFWFQIKVFNSLYRNDLFSDYKFKQDFFT